MSTSAAPKPRGRPPGAALTPDQQTKPRSIRLNDARWEKLQLLGRQWLEDKIDRAKSQPDLPR